MILVDTPRWPWRGRRWAHLVSDDSYEELHHFAHAVGKRRVGFQGDHYDVDETEQQLAIELGATHVDSRDLVRRLRESGLRNRQGLPKWAVLHDGSSADVHQTLRAVENPQLSRPMAAAVGHLGATSTGHLVILEREGEAGLLIEVDAELLHRTTRAKDLVSEVWTHQRESPRGLTVVEFLHRLG